MQRYLGPPPMNPLSRLIAAVVGVLVLAGAFFFGLLVLAVVVGLGALAWLFFRIRMWWLRRTLAGQAAGQHQAGGPGKQHGQGSESREGDVIDAEYTVVSRRDDD